MATEVDAAALLVYRAAWLRDLGNVVTKEAAMAKLAATEGSQRVIDRAVQMFRGREVRSGEVVERLYREIPALRIYERATEVQQLIIGRELLKEWPGRCGVRRNAFGTRRMPVAGPARRKRSRHVCSLRSRSDRYRCGRGPG